MSPNYNAENISFTRSCSIGKTNTRSFDRRQLLHLRDFGPRITNASCIASSAGPPIDLAISSRFGKIHASSTETRPINAIPTYRRGVTSINKSNAGSDGAGLYWVEVTFRHWSFTAMQPRRRECEGARVLQLRLTFERSVTVSEIGLRESDPQRVPH